MGAGFTQTLTRKPPAEAPDKKPDSPDNGDQLMHLLCPCKVEPIMFRCGYRPKTTRAMTPAEQAKSVWCTVCWEEKDKPCVRCGK